MDLMLLHPTTNQPTKLIENYDSLIWTERFNTIGNFELVAGDVSGFMALIPEGQRVCIRESNIAMVAETHQIIRKKNQPEQVKIMGRAFESILDRRVVLPAVAANASDWHVNAKIPSDIAWYIINQICVTGLLDANDVFPSSIVVFPAPADYVSGGTPNSGPTRTFSVPKGNLLDIVLQLIQATAKADATTSPATPVLVQKGIRAVRPNSAGTAISVEFYVGTDRTATVYFDATRDMLDDGQYLFSKRDSANTAYILGTANAAKLNKTTSAASGLDRRVILVDGISSGETVATTLQKQAEQSLSEARETAIFDGSINADLSTYKYGVDYFLGDTVKLVGDYGLTQQAIVAEYIRSEDATGNKGYPTLQTVTP
jgi:hypothetical protein